MLHRKNHLILEEGDGFFGYFHFSIIIAVVIWPSPFWCTLPEGGMQKSCIVWPPCRVAPWGPVEKRSGTVWMDGGGFIILFEQD